MPKDLPLPGIAAITCHERCCQARRITPWKRCSNAVSRKQSCGTKGRRLALITVVLMPVPPGSESANTPRSGRRGRHLARRVAGDLPGSVRVPQAEEPALAARATHAARAPDGCRPADDPAAVGLGGVLFLRPDAVAPRWQSPGDADGWRDFRRSQLGRPPHQPFASRWLPRY